MLLLFVVLHSRTLSSLHVCTTRNSSVVLLADPLHTLLEQHGSIINVIPCFCDKTMCYFSSPCTESPRGCSSPACRGCQTCPRVTRRHQRPLTSPRAALMYEQVSDTGRVHTVCDDTRLFVPVSVIKESRLPGKRSSRCC